MSKRSARTNNGRVEILEQIAELGSIKNENGAGFFPLGKRNGFDWVVREIMDDFLEQGLVVLDESGENFLITQKGKNSNNFLIRQRVRPPRLGSDTEGSEVVEGKIETPTPISVITSPPPNSERKEERKLSRKLTEKQESLLKLISDKPGQTTAEIRKSFNGKGVRTSLQRLESDKLIVKREGKFYVAEGVTTEGAAAQPEATTSAPEQVETVGEATAEAPAQAEAEVAQEAPAETVSEVPAEEAAVAEDQEESLSLDEASDEASTETEQAKAA